MISVQRSIEIRVPVHTLYSQLTQFEEYPQFMQDIESVEQRDDTHLHWKARMMDQDIEWDATITECVPDQCIAWQSESGPGNAGKVELQAVGSASSRLTFTLVSEMDIEPSTPAGDIKAELSERVWEDLTRLRSFVESRQQEGRGEQGGMHAAANATQDSSQFAVQETGIARGTGQAGNAAGREGIDEVAKLGSIEGTAQGEIETSAKRSSSFYEAESIQRDRGSPGNPVPASGFAAGSEGFSGNEDPSSPVVSAAQGSESAGPDGGNETANFSELTREQQDNPTQSDYSLSQNSEDGAQDARYSIAEEVSFDQQSDRARHIGNLSANNANGDNEGLPNAEVIAKASQRARPEPEV